MSSICATLSFIMSDPKMCRICLDSENGNTMISPCQCRGTQKYVHRMCLDDWRLSNPDRAFYQCDICRYEYRLSRVWWSNVVAHKATSIVCSGASLLLFTWYGGYMSASIYNTIYYWFHHDAYHSPHRLQTLFHGMVLVGVPGLCMGIIDLCRNMNRNMMNNPREIHIPPIHFPIFNHYHTPKSSRSPRSPQSRRSPRSPRTSEQKDDKDKKDKTNPKTPVAKHEEKSCLIWTMLVMGVAMSFYYSYRWVHTKFTTIVSRVQYVIENYD